MGIAFHIEMEAHAGRFRFPAFHYGNAVGDGDCHCVDVAGVVVHCHFFDRKLPFVGKEGGFPRFGYFGRAAVGGLWGVGHLGGRAVDFRLVGSPFRGILYGLFDPDGRHCSGHYDIAVDD